MKSIVTIGGGTGQYTLLSGLKKYPVQLTAIVSMADDGGSTGVLRDELGVLPPGDIRQCLVALSEAESLVRELFNYRFDAGGLKGHNFGNIFLSALEKITGNFEEAVRVSGMVLATRGSVIPVTTQNARLVCETPVPAGIGAAVIRGQYAIETAKLPVGARLGLEPEVYANPKAVEAIERADCIIIGPGNLYCSILPNLLVKGIPEAINRSRAKVVYNCNLMTKAGHTDGFDVNGFIRSVEGHVGDGRVDFVTANSRVPERELLDRYAAEGEYPVQPAVAADVGARLLAADLISRNIPVLKEGDPIKRTLIRHDPDTLAALIIANCLGGL
jgi:uncharacterized cofD-like protein